jgi:hypothetical protein
VTFRQQFKAIFVSFYPGIIGMQIVNLIYGVQRFFHYGFFEALGRTTSVILFSLVLVVVVEVMAIGILRLINAVKDFKAANRA